jgi:predicted nuclease of predicted toxin-antitoxin system
MNIKILIDMNLSPNWVRLFNENNIEAAHWSKIGRSDEKDATVLKWAKDNNHIVFTHDLDFGAILAATNAEFPSVIQLRTQDIFPDKSSKILLEIIKEHEQILNDEALIIIDESKMRLRILPLKK